MSKALNKNIAMKTIALMLLIYDAIATCISFFIAFFLRFDCIYSAIPGNLLAVYQRSIIPVSLFTIAVFYLLKLYRSIWKYVSYREYITTVIGTAFSLLFNFVITSVLFERMPISYYLMGGILQFCAVLDIRFLYRLLNLLRVIHKKNRNPESSVMIIGAGEAGRVVLREIQSAEELNDKVVCFIDDDSSRWNRYVNGFVWCNCSGVSIANSV